MYALAVVPLISKLQQMHEHAQQVWFADDATAASTCQRLRAWWDNLVTLGPVFGYYPKAAKTFLVVKEEFVQEAERVFADTNILITPYGKRHLGAAHVPVNMYKYVSNLAKDWCNEVKVLSNVARSQPHAAYAAYIHGLATKWSYISRTIPDIGHMLEPLEAVIKEKFIPALTGQPPCSETRALIASTTS